MSFLLRLERPPSSLCCRCSEGCNHTSVSQEKLSVWTRAKTSHQCDPVRAPQCQTSCTNLFLVFRPPARPLLEIHIIVLGEGECPIYHPFPVRHARVSLPCASQVHSSHDGEGFLRSVSSDPCLSMTVSKECCNRSFV